MATLEYIVNAVDDASSTFSKIGLSADGLSRKLDDLGKKDVAPGVGLEDKTFTAKMLDASKRLDALSKKVAKPDIDIQGLAKASLEIDRLEKRLDGLNKTYTPKVDVKSGIFAKVKGFLTGAAGGAAGGAASGAASGAGGGGAGGGLAALANPYAIGGIAAVVLPGLLNALVGQGVGTGVGLAGVYGAKKYDPKVFKAGLDQINRSIRPVFESIAPSIGLMFAQLGRFTQSQQVPLAKLFGASLPFIQQFIKLTEQIAKTLFPSLTQVMKEFVQTGALKEMTQGFVYLTQGLAIFIKDMGPGFKAGAETFRATAIVVRDLVIGLGEIVGGLGGAWTHAFGAIHNAWDSFRHWFAGEFDSWRHGWSHDWDVLWNDTIGAFIRFNGTFIRDLGNWLGNVVTWFSRLPGKIERVFNGALNWLYGAGKNVIQGLWNGLLFIWHKVTSFISGIGNWIKQHKGPVSLDQQLLEPAGRALMSGLLRGLTGGFGDVAAFIGGVAGSIARGLGFGGGGPTALQQAAAKLMPSFGWDPRSQLPALIALWDQESGWNPYATNPSSGAYGIPQALPANKMASAGADWRTNPITQILWGLGYIKSRYGSPSSAEAHELAFHWYGKGLKGGLFTRPTLIGVGEAGTERVDITPVSSGRAHGGPLVHVAQMVVQDATDVSLVSHRLNFLITSASLGP